nr:MAG TPA: hypothetical protein [Caudoviricetes sp.]
MTTRVSNGPLPITVSAQMTRPPLLSAPTGAGAKSYQARAYEHEE